MAEFARWPVSIDVGVLFVGGRHQAPHVAPVAAELARRPDVKVTGYATTGEDAEAITAMLHVLDTTLEIVPMQLPHILERFVHNRPAKIARLLTWQGRLRGHDVLLTAERTSTILKRLAKAVPCLVHIPHGAGDRAKGFEGRLAHFDHIIVSGEKDRRRMIADGLVEAAQCTVSGSIKLDYVAYAKPNLPRLFDNALPTILYNPHFSRSLSSWPSWGIELVERLSEDPSWNLIVAPHIRTLATMTRKERKQWEALVDTPRRRIDYRSDALIDMTYTRSADIYVGDVSSQVYEFVAAPRPCVFLNANRVDWKGSADFLMWRFGAVADTVEAALAEIAAARLRHVEFAAIQENAAFDALGSRDGCAAARAADAVINTVSGLWPTSPR